MAIDIQEKSLQDFCVNVFGGSRGDYNTYLRPDGRYLVISAKDDKRKILITISNGRFKLVRKKKNK